MHIFTAVEENDVEYLQAILSTDPTQVLAIYSPNAPHRPIHVAAWLNHKEALLLLIHYGANVNIRGNHEWTPLHYAAYHSSPQTAQVLIEQAAKIDALDQNGFTPLFIASRARDMERQKVINLLVQRGAKIDLNTAVSLGDLKHVQNLLTADLHAVHKARFPNELIYDAVVAIQSHIADIHTPTAAPNNAHYIIQQYIPMLEQLVAWGADVNDIGFAGWPPLYIAVQMEQTDIAQFLLEHGADINFQTQEGVSIFDLVHSIGSSTEMQALLYSYQDHNGIR